MEAKEKKFLLAERTQLQEQLEKLAEEKAILEERLQNEELMKTQMQQMMKVGKEGERKRGKGEREGEKRKDRQR